jgi:Carbohydrate family 9 binding domain-like
MIRVPCGTVLCLGALSVSLVMAPGGDSALGQTPAQRPRVTVRPTADFAVTGTGDGAAWQAAEWVDLRRRQADGHPYETRFKILYSGTGLYVLMDATDRRLTATLTEDFADLWHEDVFEVFLWPDERHSVYFEYEISPLDKELAILVPNFGGEFLGWRPWHYEKDRRVRKATSVTGGPKQSHASVRGWRAEFFIPYALLRPLPNVPPEPGARWRANFYRIDHDNGTRTHWEWAPVEKTFHDYQNYGELLFGGR